jgi:hypothetical protein
MKFRMDSEALEPRVLLSGGNLSFGGTGTAAIAADPAFQIRDVAVQADGKVVVAGITTPAPIDLLVQVF